MDEIIKKRPTIESGVSVPATQALPERHAKVAQDMNKLVDNVAQNKRRLKGW